MVVISSESGYSVSRKEESGLRLLSRLLHTQEVRGPGPLPPTTDIN